MYPPLNIHNLSTRSHPSEEENRTSIRSKNQQVQSSLKSMSIWGEAARVRASYPCLFCVYSYGNRAEWPASARFEAVRQKICPHTFRAMER
jgi:hypothetical protein